MKGILIKQKEGHIMDGKGELLGKDFEGNSYTFWSFTGDMEVPAELAIQLEKERPQRYEIVDRNLASVLLTGKSLVIKPEVPKMPKPKKSILITLKELKEMTKNEINDFGAKNDYDVNERDKKSVMIKELCKQIEKRTGQIVR